MTEQRKGKVTLVEKTLDDNGNQTTWTNKEGKTFYNSSYTFDNGDSGKALHLTSEPKYKVGDELTYEKKVNEYGTSFSKLKDVNSTFNKKFTPLMTDDQSLRSTCMHTVIILRSNGVDLPDAAGAANALFEDAKKMAQTNERGDIVMIQSSMKIARESTTVKSLSELISLTSKIYSYIKG